MKKEHVVPSDSSSLMKGDVSCHFSTYCVPDPWKPISLPTQNPRGLCRVAEATLSSFSVRVARVKHKDFFERPELLNFGTPVVPKWNTPPKTPERAALGGFSSFNNLNSQILNPDSFYPYLTTQPFLFTSATIFSITLFISSSERVFS